MAGRNVGINFNKSRRFINTIDGHRLVEWCNEYHPDKSNELMEQLFHAYFEEAKDLSKVDELISIATSIGLPVDKIQELYRTEQYRAEVLNSDQQSKRNLRVSGVPYFIIENNNGSRPVAFSGAQVQEMFLLSFSYIIAC